jgi:flagellar motor protein MotB
MDSPNTEGDEVSAWPAMTDLLAASSLVFVALLAVTIFVSNRAAGSGTGEGLRIDSLFAVLDSAAATTGLFSVAREPTLVRITLPEAITFPSGQFAISRIRPEGRSAIGTLAGILTSARIAPTYERIIVLGHTDQVPMPAGDVSNWELSAARAAAVARFLVREGVDPCRVLAWGLGPFRPVDSLGPTRPSERNRRVELALTPSRDGSGATSERCAPDGDGVLGRGS